MVYPVPQQSPSAPFLAAESKPPYPQSWWQSLLTPPTVDYDPWTGTYREMPPGAQAEMALQATIPGPTVGGFLGPAAGPGVAAAGGARPRRLLMEDPAKLSTTPPVPQSYLPRQQRAGRVRPATQIRMEQMYDPANIARTQEAAQRGAEAGGLAWHNTEPLREAAIETLGEEAGNLFHQGYMAKVAATSPRAKVSDNIRRAGYFQTQEARGLPIGSLDQPPSPYGHIAHKTHAPMLEQLQLHGMLDPVQQPKAASFTQNLAGNQAPLTADTHYARGIGYIRPEEKTRGVSPLEYGGLEEFGRGQAAELGMTPAQYQASLWMGLADETGVANPQIFMQSFNDALERTAAARGVKPKKALDDFLRGKAPLLGLSGAAAGLYGSLAGPEPEVSVEAFLGGS